jgi:hypothetical protein
MESGVTVSQTYSFVRREASNTFFLKFPNCLAYETMTEALEKLRWALKNDPTPLTESLAHEFTWEGATERLYTASAISKQEERQRIESGQEKADREVAWMHVESLKKGLFITSFLP